jgi:hypothetical protein
MLRTMLTTIDNPHSPFENWDAWLAYDMAAGYNSSGLLARVAVVSSELSDVDYNNEIARAVDEIVSENVSGVHRKVTKEVEPSFEVSEVIT